jgi:hypothetical protein
VLDTDWIPQVAARGWLIIIRKPKLEEVAANLIDLAWNGLSHLDANGRESAKR